LARCRSHADLVYNGFWSTPLREAIDPFVAAVQPRETGAVRLEPFMGAFLVVGRASPHALYEHALATYDEGDRFEHAAAEGFIRIWGLPVETAARRAPGETVANRR
jgi:argininosuccinate synthase